MLIDTNKTVSITSANQNFTHLLKKVDEIKDVIIMKRNKPKYVILDFEFYETLITKLMAKEADKIMDEHYEVFEELAK